MTEGEKAVEHMKSTNRFMQYPVVRRYFPTVKRDLSETYARNLHKWLVIAPLIGVTAGLTITAVAVIILRKMWPPILEYYLRHHWAIVPGLALGCALTGLIMQHFTRDPNQHSTEEVIQSYHEHEGAIDMRAFPAKLLAAVTTVGFGGSAALEGPEFVQLARMIYRKLAQDPISLGRQLQHDMTPIARIASARN